LTETVENTATGAILYDKAIINQMSEERFTPEGWLHAELLTGSLRSGGRGNTMFVGNVPRQFVLRHYMRGGLVGKVVRDTYIFSGADKTRSFMEWRLLDKLASNNMRVPRPAAARYTQRGTFYLADIITVRVPDIVPLSQYIADHDPNEAFWNSVGASINDAQPFASVAAQDCGSRSKVALPCGKLGTAARGLFRGVEVSVVIRIAVRQVFELAVNPEVLLRTGANMILEYRQVTLRICDRIIARKSVERR